MNFQMFKLDLEKAQEPETKLPTSTGSSKKQESSRKISTSALLTVPKPLTVWIKKKKKKTWKILKKFGNTRLPGLPLETSVYRFIKQQLELDMEKQTDAK